MPTADNADDLVRFRNVTVISSTATALFCGVGGKSVWLPRRHISGRLSSMGDRGTLLIRAGRHDRSLLRPPHDLVAQLEDRQRGAEPWTAQDRRTATFAGRTEQGPVVGDPAPRIRSVPRSPMLESLPLMCRRGSQTLLPPTPQNRAVAVELMTVTFRNRTRSSALSAVAWHDSPSGVRAEHTWVGSGAPCTDRAAGLLNGLETSVSTRDEGARYGQAVTLGTLRNGQFGRGKVIGSTSGASPFSAPQRDDGRVFPFATCARRGLRKGTASAVRGHDREFGA